jgi:hypothetical protein
MASAEDGTPILGAPIRVPVHRDSPILWIDMFMPSAHALASQWPRPQSSNSQDCGSEGIIQCGNVIHYADVEKDRGLILSCHPLWASRTADGPVAAVASARSWLLWWAHDESGLFFFLVCGPALQDTRPELPLTDVYLRGVGFGG